MAIARPPPVPAVMPRWRDKERRHMKRHAEWRIATAFWRRSRWRRARPRGTSSPGCRRRSPDSTPCEAIGRRLERFRLRPMDGDWPCRQVDAATGEGALRERRGSAANSRADTSRRCGGSGLAKRVQPSRVSRLTRRRFRARACRFQSSLSEQRLISPTWRPPCPAPRAGEFRRKPGNRHAGRNPVKCEPYSPATGEPEWPLGET